MAPLRDQGPHSLDPSRPTFIHYPLPITIVEYSHYIPYDLPLMCKPEIQSFVALISGVVQVMPLLILRHRAPLLVPASVAQDVVQLNEKIKNNVHRCNG